jgi:hypothetical protein
MTYFTMILFLSYLQTMLLMIKGHILHMPIKNIILGIFTVFIIIMAGTRIDIGYDYDTYKSIFRNIKFYNLSLLEVTVEPGYFLLNVLSSNFQMVIFLCALISIPIKIFMFYKKSETIIIALILYLSTIFLTYDMGVIRQGIALSIVFLSIKYIEDKKIIKFAACILVAMLFHVSSFIFFPAYFIVNREFSRKLIYLITVICFVVGFVGFGDWIFNISNIITSTTIGTKLEYYETSVYSTSVISITSLKRFILLAVFIEVSRKLVNKSKALNIYINCYFIGCCIYYLFKSFSLLSDRGSAYYNSFEIFIFAVIFNRVKSKFLKMLLLLFIILYSVYNINSIIQSGNKTDQFYDPYKSILFERG